MDWRIRRNLAGVRTKFVLVVVLGAIVPLGVTGFWFAQSARRAGEDLLRNRLEGTLGEIARDVGVRWAPMRSALLDVLEHPVARDAFHDRATPSTLAFLDSAVRAAGAAGVLTLRDRQGRALLTAGPGRAEPRLTITLAAFEPRTGARLGSLDAVLVPESLVTAHRRTTEVAGAVLAVFDTASGVAMGPAVMDRSLLRRRAFEWAGEQWLSVRHTLSDPPMELAVAAPLGPFSTPFADAARRGMIALVAIALAALVLAAVVSGRLSRSLVALADAAEAVTGGDLNRRVDAIGHDEVARVAESFNRMTESLKSTLGLLSQRQSLAAVGEFAASLAHEVRNPLSAIRLDLQRACERVHDADAHKLLTRTLEAISRLDRTVRGALQIARSGRLIREPVDLRQPLRSAIASAGPDFLERRATFTSRGEDAGALIVEADAAAMEQVFLNLLLNAAQAVNPGGQAGIETVVEGRTLEVLVWNTGPGIPAAVRERIFEPFYSTRPDGTGLGLAVARRIVEAHGGGLELAATEPGKTGLAVRLPASDREVRSSSTT